MRSIVATCAAALLVIGGTAHGQSAGGSTALPGTPGTGMDTTAHVDSAPDVATQDSASGSTALPDNPGQAVASGPHSGSTTGATSGTATGSATRGANAGRGRSAKARATATKITTVRHHHRRPR